MFWLLSYSIISATRHGNRTQHSKCLRYAEYWKSIPMCYSINTNLQTGKEMANRELLVPLSYPSSVRDTLLKSPSDTHTQAAKNDHPKRQWFSPLSRHQLHIQARWLGIRVPHSCSHRVNGVHWHLCKLSPTKGKYYVPLQTKSLVGDVLQGERVISRR